MITLDFWTCLWNAFVAGVSVAVFCLFLGMGLSLIRALWRSEAK